MTVIAWDGKTLAADKRATNGTLIRTTTKIRRIHGALVGFSGSADAAEEVMAWLSAGAEPSKYPAVQKDRNDNASVLVIRKDSISLFERGPIPVRFDVGQQFAIGCGRDFAMAAMYLGNSAMDAVAVACALDNSCGNGIDFLDLDQS